MLYNNNNNNSVEYYAKNQFNIRGNIYGGTQIAGDTHTYNNNLQFIINSHRDTQILYTTLTVSQTDLSKDLEKIATAINLMLNEDEYETPFVPPIGFGEWKQKNKLYLYGISGSGKSRCMYEIVKQKITSFKRVLIINPTTLVGEESGRLSISEIFDKLNSGDDLVIWDDFPDGLQEGQDPKYGQEAIIRISSSFIRNLIVGLKSSYLELYREMDSKVPELTFKELIYDREAIRKTIELYGDIIPKFREIYGTLIQKDIYQISSVLYEKEPIPLTVIKYYETALDKYAGGYLNPILLAREFSLSQERYIDMFRYIIKERPNEADFLATVKLAYELEIPRTRANIRKLQEKLFSGSSFPTRPEVDLSNWISVLMGQYSISHETRKAIEYPEDRKPEIMEYLSSDEFLRFLSDNRSVYNKFGVFYGRNIQFVQHETSDFFAAR